MVRRCRAAYSHTTDEPPERWQIVDIRREIGRSMASPEYMTSTVGNGGPT